ncbi:immunoglobulin kappa light chain-like isoform X6 [Pelobates cultripes]|nr:immunoglobulin kappa light chain-like isoform X6 [Pelobates cultripes]
MVDVSIVWVFSQSSKLIVTVDKFPEPAINVFAPYVEDHSTKDNQVLTCHVRKMSVSLVNVKWIKDGTTIQDGVSTSQPTRETDNTFSMSSYLTIPASDLNKDSIYSCWVQQEGSSSFTSQGINLSQC